MSKTKEFQMKLSLNVLEHLGINLYSNVPSVLSEVVANSWDADAKEVNVVTDKGNDKIIIKDDGTGMTYDELNARFLLVGYRRRDSQPPVTELNRKPMGRKGIGKLSLFSIASEILVESVKNGEKNAFLMKLEDIREKIKDGEGVYFPQEQSVENINFKKGTRITLSKIKKRQSIRTTLALRKRLARRFSIIGPQHEFKILVNNEEVTPSDRGYYNKIQYLWTYGDQSEILELTENKSKHEDRSEFVENDELEIRGWLGTVEKSDQLRDEEGENLNRIAIFVRGKMAQEDFLSDFTERGVYASYLIGELYVDGLDDDDKPDAATSSRQKLVEDDDRYQSLKSIIYRELKHIQKKWSEYRSEDGVKKALEIPAVNSWMQGLPSDVKPNAKIWLGKLNKVQMDDNEEKKKLIKHAILAFEFYRWNTSLEKLDDIDEKNIADVIELFRELDNLELNLYGQIVQQRIKVIDTLQRKVDDQAREKVIQEYIFDHLWLIDPAWERADSPALMEKRVTSLFDNISSNLSDEEKRARIDIQYRKTAGEHVVIELKKPDRTVSVYDLAKQIRKYKSGMEKILDDMNRGQESVEFICLLGKYPYEWNEKNGKQTVVDTLKPLNARIVHYDELLDNAFQSYKDYIDQRKNVDQLSKIIQEIEDFSDE